MRDVPNCIDDFFRLRFVWFNRRTWRFFWLRSLVEYCFRKVRFVSFTEFLEIYRDKATVKDFGDLRRLYPVFKLLSVSNIEVRNRFVNSYPKSLEGYFQLMKRNNKRLYQIFNRSYPIRLPD